MACAEGRNVTALYALESGEYVSYILGAPEFVNAGFRALFADGVPTVKPLTVKSDGPATADPAPEGGVAQPWPACLQGEIGEGFNLVVYEGGSVGELEACARDRNVTAVYTLNEGEIRLLHPRRPGLREPGLRRAVRGRCARRDATGRKERLAAHSECRRRRRDGELAGC